jgi:hypothetical protein
VYFDAAGAQNAVDQFIPKKTAEAGGKKSSFSDGVLIFELAP